MRILLTNDDGYQSKGILVLEDVLLSYGHEVWVSAPSSQRSACSHSMNVFGGVIATRFSKNHYHISGYPVDTVAYALEGKLFSSLPDVVVSGINHGYNISTDTLYSGTIGAASEAAMRGIPAIAVSAMCDGEGFFPFPFAARFLAEHIEAFIPLCGEKSFVSINVPPMPTGDWDCASLSYLDYHDVVQVDKGEKENETALRIVGGNPTVREGASDADFFHLQKGTTTVSALSVLPALDSQGQAMLHAIRKAERD